jgi:hypothetical protein
MTHDLTADRKTYWIAHDSDKIESGVLPEGGTLSTGMAYLETYTSPLVQQTRLHRLRGNYRTALGEWLETLRLRDPFQFLADYRWRKETGGITLPSGVRIHTDQTTQSKITSMILGLSSGLVVEPISWKAQNGWVSLSQADMFAMAGAVTTHVKRCFAAEEHVLGLLAESDTVNVTAAFDQAYEAIE